MATLAVLHAIASSAAYTVTIVGGTGGLGRELTQQCRDRGWTPIVLCRSADRHVYPPVRNGWLTPVANANAVLPPFANLDVRSTSDPPPYSDAVVFSLSGKPFTQDTSTEVVRHVLTRTDCNKIAYISAHGVAGNATSDANAGIGIMRNLYLKSTYDAKRDQEALVCACKHATWRVWRPRALSYTYIPFNSVTTPRSVLARDVLDWCTDDGPTSY